MDEQKGGLLVVMAHPDDESMGTGGLILRHTRNDVTTNLICATGGEKGWMGRPPGAYPGELPAIRVRELRDAAEALGLAAVELWDYPDGGVKESDQQEITQRVWEHILKLRPRAVVGWGEDGAYGHPDHIAMGACTDAAVAAMTEGDRPGLYHIAIDQTAADLYDEVIRVTGDHKSMTLRPKDQVDIVMNLDPDEVIMKLRAIDCHRSQLEDWRIALLEHPGLMQRFYGHEPYVTVSSRSTGLTGTGLLGEFA
ncbi:MAG TPA: PIG-L family deacetylase [Candidatus Dormibacteraeota bacterium]|nr:PIG-L family deacetylase [Candidatus Dormibacteraeota bacterium]